MLIKINSKKKLGRGQTLPLFALALVALLGITALSIDGGMLLAERRQAQNVTDNAAMSGALLLADNYANQIDAAEIQDAAQLAFARAAANGYNNDGTTNTVNVTVTGPINKGIVYFLFEVTISSEVPTSFAHLVFDQPLNQTTSSVVRVQPKQSMMNGWAMVGLNEHDCKTVWMMGSVDVQIYNAGIYSNSDATGCGALDQDGSAADVYAETGVKSAGEIQCKAAVQPLGCESTGIQYPRPIIPTPVCDPTDTTWEDVSVKKGGKSGGATVLLPGNYGDIDNNNGDLFLEPGLYCINGDLKFTGGTTRGFGVMFYIVNGNFDSQGNGTVDLSAPSNLFDFGIPANQWRGMLIYTDQAGHSFDLGGNSDSVYTGTVYNPWGTCDIQGNSDALNLTSSQIMCDTIKIHGNPEYILTYDASKLYQLPPAMDLEE